MSLEISYKKKLTIKNNKTLNIYCFNFIISKFNALKID